MATMKDVKNKHAAILTDRYTPAITLDHDKSIVNSCAKFRKEK